MQLFRPAFAQHPLHFGRGPMRMVEPPLERATPISGDVKLFIATFAAGFLFVSILIS